MWKGVLLTALFFSAALWSIFQLSHRRRPKAVRADPLRAGGVGFYAGLNLPPNQGSSGTGAFIPGIYKYDYTKTMVANIAAFGFTAIRLPINIPTAADPSSLKKLKEYVDAIGGKAIICMFGTDTQGDGHGTGRVDNVAATAEAWANIHKAFASYPLVMYELFNEPFGYTNAKHYHSDMQTIMTTASLPIERCILAGLSYESSLKDLVKLGWTGDLGYHVYPNWLPDGDRTQEKFSNKIQQDLDGLSSRVWITEFGGALNLANVDYSQYDPSGFGGNVNMFRGLHDALLTFKAHGQPVKGAFHWHGWHNGDSYDFWAAGNSNGAHKVRSMLADMKASNENEFEVKALLV